MQLSKLYYYELVDFSSCTPISTPKPAPFVPRYQVVTKSEPVDFIWIIDKINGLVASSGLAANYERLCSGWTVHSKLMKILRDPERPEEKALAYLQELSSDMLMQTTSRTCLERIRENAPGALEEALSACRKKMFLSGINICLPVAAVIVSSVSLLSLFLFSGAAATITLAALGSVIALIWIGSEAYQLHQVDVATDPGKWDKWILLASAVCVVASLAFTCLFFPGLESIVCGSVVTGVWLTVDAVSYARIKYMEWRG
ncbi:MAG: hypothetical protein JSS61_07515 [Verrucomicrobia bacterium]|nr:hypothetical protein [Verrucomicrobiota bacterium]